MLLKFLGQGLFISSGFGWAYVPSHFSRRTESISAGHWLMWEPEGKRLEALKSVFEAHLLLRLRQDCRIYYEKLVVQILFGPSY